MEMHTRNQMSSIANVCVSLIVCLHRNAFIKLIHPQNRGGDEKEVPEIGWAYRFPTDSAIHSIWEGGSI